MNFARPVALLALVATTVLAAQSAATAQTPEVPPKPAPQGQEAPAEPETLSLGEARALYTKACRKMSNLQGVTFTTETESTSALARQLGRNIFPGGRQIGTIEGRWTPSLSEVWVGDDHELLIHGTRMVARGADQNWVLRRNCLTDGSSLPFLLDPGLLFEALRDVDPADFELTRTETVQIQGADAVLVSVTVEGDAAHELVFSGALPKIENAMIIRMGGMGNAPRPDLTIDLAIYIDPTSSLVRRIVARSTEESALRGAMGNVVFNINGANVAANADEKEKVATHDAGGDRIYEDGLPVRANADKSVGTTTMTFSDHDKPLKTEVDDRAKRLLRLR